MIFFTDSDKRSIEDICTSTVVAGGPESNHDLLIKKLDHLFPGLKFKYTLTRGGWYRSGGVVTEENKPVANDLRQWLESVSTNDINQFIEDYLDAAYIVSKLKGQTHYFIAQTGDDAENFVQLEIEELQEVRDRFLLNENALPDDIEDMIEPVDFDPIEAEPVGEPHYLFRRITAIDEYIKSMSLSRIEQNDNQLNIQRFIDDWKRSSAHETGPFCQHWVLSLQQYHDAWGEPVTRARPISTFCHDLPLVKLDKAQRGSELARLIHRFDRTVGYPMAWYFYMLSHTEVPHDLAESIHQDLMGAYDYLPPRDVKIVNDWYKKPYMA